MLLGLIAPMLVIGCATATSEQPPRLVCPEIVAYSKETQKRAADELDTLPPGSAVAELVGDYLQLRDRIRVCRGQ